MRVRVLLFGDEARRAGCDHVDVELDDGAAAADVRAAVERACPALAGSIGHVRLARNNAFAGPDEAIRAGDELALIGLVSGG
ncbi:MAG: MoaD/ThiS family protein [Phycisphaerales bacterium]|nr:MoaD/ThiS family protein [Phycisphaerales bacterium]